MPADDSYWRSPKKLHVWFALSAIGLLVATLLMMGRDHSAEWRGYQDTFDEINELRLNAQIEAETSADYEERLAKLEDRLVAANERIDAAAERIEMERKASDEKIDDPELAATLKTRQIREQRAIRDVARANYDLAIRDGETEAAKRLMAIYDREQDLVDEYELELQEIQKQLDDESKQLAELTATRDQIEAEIKALQSDREQLVAAREKIAPEGFLSAAKRTVMEWPIIDGFNSPRKINQIWLPELKVTLGMAHTARFDRCTTCHLGIDQVETGNVPAYPHGHPESGDVADWVAANEYPHPFSTHPNPDLYLTATSPHPMMTFGCTACHDGQGSGTSFTNASHTPNNPVEAEKWEHEHDYHSNHYWEYPMLPDRFEQSSCLKCHHQVVELETSPKFGNSAPKLMKGYHTIENFGCFGCHEVNGFAGGQSIGPDMRLEPNWFAVAQQIKAEAQPLLGPITASPTAADQVPSGVAVAERAGEQPGEPAGGRPGEQPGPESRAETGLNEPAARTLERIVELADEIADAPFDTDAQREELQSLLLADESMKDSRLSARAHALAGELDDVAHPGRFRKVGPSLRYLHNKTDADWVAYWTEEPDRFRPSTRMPQFFHLTNQEDAAARRYQPAEIRAITAYLLGKSQQQPFEYLAPQAGYQPNAERGKQLFSERGCLACHTHSEFPGIDSDFGPNLDRVHAKLKDYDPAAANFTGSDAFGWLYTWIRDPQRYHKRSRMPNLYLETYQTEGAGGSQTVDPAADIAAWLLQKGPEDFEDKAPEVEPHLGLVFNTEDHGGPGLLVSEVLRFSPASRARPANPEVKANKKNGEPVESEPTPLEPGDVVLAVNGKAVTTAAAFHGLIRKLQPGTEVTLKFRRGGEGSEEITATAEVSSPVDDLIRLYLSKVLTNPQVEQTLATRRYPFDRDMIKGDEIELSREAADAEMLSEDEWEQRKLAYLGRRTISRYGCYGCHDIPGFENAKPIGTALQDWGRKDTSKLATEHIAEYLHHNGHGDEPSTAEAVEQSLKAARADEYASEEVREEAMTTAYYYESLLHHGRPGFLWQKLRAPRSYDYKKTETKGYDERLRMPKFPFEQDDIEAVATFVLGLVAEPPAGQYVYQPTASMKARYEGEFLLEKYNCASCHMLDMPRVRFAIERDSESEPADYSDHVGMTLADTVDWFAENREVLTSGLANPDEYPDDIQLINRLAEFFGLDTNVQQIARAAEPDAKAPDPDAAYRDNVRTWLEQHPEVRLTAFPQGDLPHGVLKLLEFKPPVPTATGERTPEGDAIMEFTGLKITEFPDEDPPIDSYQVWDTLDIAGRVELPATQPKLVPQPRLLSVKPARGGTFAQWLVNHQIPEAIRGRGELEQPAVEKLWATVPPPLYMEGLKVQTPWLYRFLKNPERIRWTTVLRMPRFNMSDQEARALANYFAAVDDADFPYQDLPQREEPYLDRKDEQLEEFLDNQQAEYLKESWMTLGKNSLCIGCHSIMGREFKGGTAEGTTHAPDLAARTADRLRPDWLEVWFYKPKWLLPYTTMPAPHTDPVEGYFRDDKDWQLTALRDALLNYHRLMQDEGVVPEPPPAETEAAGPEAAGTEAAAPQ